MADWEGFTEADLQKLNINSNQNNQSHQPKIIKPVKRSAASNKSKVGNYNKKGTTAMSRKTTNAATNAVPSAALLTNPPTPSKPVTKSKTPNEKSNQHSEPKLQTNDVKATPTDEANVVVDDAVIQEKEKLKLEDVHQRQKQMEEKNRRKKAMLTKEIAERKKRALAESTKLVKIQSELAKLDQLLNVDVSLLRDRIDTACVEYSAAQKRFEKAESEYITSKMELHNKTTLKEDLTEHLFNLIQANEERKAKKLEELMHQLDVEDEQLEAKEAARAESLKKDSDDSPDSGSGHTAKNDHSSEPTSDGNKSHNPPVDSAAGDSAGNPKLTKLSESSSSGETLHGATKETITS